MSQNDLKKIQAFVSKVDDMKKFDKVDLSSDQDLTIAIMNLIGIEEHLFFSGAKTEKTAYYDLITEVRDIRKGLLKKLIKEYEGEVWCISKHLLASSYRLMEVGTKLLDRNEKQEAYEFFTKSFELYSLFWGLNLNIITSQDVDLQNNLEVNLSLKSGVNLEIEKSTSKKADFATSHEVKILNFNDNDNDNDKNKDKNNDNDNAQQTSGIKSKLKNLVRKVIDCCIE